MGEPRSLFIILINSASFQLLVTDPFTTFLYLSIFDDPRQKYSVGKVPHIVSLCLLGTTIMEWLFLIFFSGDTVSLIKDDF